VAGSLLKNIARPEGRVVVAPMTVRDCDKAWRLVIQSSGEIVRDPLRRGQASLCHLAQSRPSSRLPSDPCAEGDVRTRRGNALRAQGSKRRRSRYMPRSVLMRHRLRGNHLRRGSQESDSFQPCFAP
jgi:hypothetical protein